MREGKPFVTKTKSRRRLGNVDRTILGTAAAWTATKMGVPGSLNDPGDTPRGVAARVPHPERSNRDPIRPVAPTTSPREPLRGDLHVVFCSSQRSDIDGNSKGAVAVIGADSWDFVFCGCGCG